MKKIFLLTILLFQLTFVFGQSEWTEYGSWFSNRCFPQIQSRIKVISNPKSNTTSVMVEFKNNYARKVTFMFSGFNTSIEAEQVFAEKGNLLGGQQSSISLGSGQSSTYTFSIKGSGGNRAHIEIYTLYFDNDYQHYQKCNDGSICLYCQVNGYNEPACPNYSKTATNKNTSTAQQNDLSEYNHSKADLERQMAEKNAEGQQKSQNYTTAMNAGISAHNSGNYAEAKRQFSIALNNCNSEEARRKAQEYYNKTVDSEKSQVNIKAVGDITTTLIMGIGEISEERKRKKEEEENKKREEEEESEKYKNELDKDISDSKNGDFDAQISMGGRCFDAYLFEPAEKYYLKAFKNINKSEEKFLKMKLITVLSINGKKDNLLNLISNDADNFLKEMLILNDEKYFRNSIITDSLKQNSINTLKKISKYNKDAAVTIAYYQITGEYENLKVEKNIESGLKELNYYTTNYKYNLSRTNSLAHYYMGLLYLKGCSGIKVNKAKAMDYFINSIEISDYKIKEKKDLINMPRFSIYVNYFDGAFLSYIQATSVLSDSSKKMDKEIGDIMKHNISKYYVNLVSLNFQELFSIK